MAYILVVLMSHGFYGPTPIEFAGRVACENAKVEIMKFHNQSRYGIETAFCLPKSAPKGN